MSRNLYIGHNFNFLSQEQYKLFKKPSQDHVEVSIRYILESLDLDPFEIETQYIHYKNSFNNLYYSFATFATEEQKNLAYILLTRNDINAYHTGKDLLAATGIVLDFS